MLIGVGFPRLLAVVLPVVLDAGRAPAPGAPCSLSPFPIFRDSSTIVLLGKAEQELAPTVDGVAQRILVLRLGGAHRDAISMHLRKRSDRAVWVVPRGHDGACRPTPWRGPPMWAPLDSTGVYELRLRPEPSWVAGWPTFDAYTASLQPCPLRIAGVTQATRRSALSASEYFDFLLTLPGSPPEQSSRMPPSLQRWIARHGDLAERFPAARTVEFWRRQLR